MRSRAICASVQHWTRHVRALDGTGLATRYLALSLLLTLAVLIQHETLPTLMLRFFRAGMGAPHMDDPCGSGPLPC
jgi:hypothetical protein